MPTLHPPRPRSKPCRTAHVGQHHAEAGFRVLQICMGKSSTLYTLTAVPSELGGRGFRLDKFESQGGGEPYFVHIADDGCDSCECLGFLRWGTPCKHIQTIRQLVAEGRLS